MDVQDEDGWTALMSAAQYGHATVMERLFKAGADVDVQQQNGWAATRRRQTRAERCALRAGDERDGRAGGRWPSCYSAR